MQPIENIVKNLNERQKEACLWESGPLLILAGAGSGKTRVLTHQVARLVGLGFAHPEQILAVTFTNKAAREMESRIYALLDHPLQSLWVSTFHSFCSRILRTHISKLGYQSEFSIYDDSDQLSQIKKIMTALNISEKMYSAKFFKSKISHCKMLAASPEKLHMDDLTQKVYFTYEQEMKKSNALDFDDLLLKTYDLFQQRPDVLSELQNQFRYILVDEYQDTNHIQYLLIKALAHKHHNLCVVGDEDQSIYSWRGADIRNILDFETDFPEAKIIKLEQNYRSTQNIVTAASRLIQNNTERKEKTLFTENESGDLIRVHEETNEYDEARWVARQIQVLRSEENISYNEMAIFYRTNSQSRVLEEQLRFLSIPYQIVGGVRFYERMEIKDILGYLKMAANPTDDIAFKRIINTPTRGIGKTTVESLEELAFQEKISLWDACQKAVETRRFNSGTSNKLRHFNLLMEDLINQVKSLDPLQFYQYVLEKSDYYSRLKQEATSESKARIQNLEELSNAISQYMKERPESTIPGFLEEMSLVSDIDSKNDDLNSVTLMTLHVSKGLEFPYVFIVGMEENLFPSSRSREETDEESSLEEERRLAYVGMTRARKKLHLSYARSRRVWGQEQFNPPSRFISELPQNLLNSTSSINRTRFAERMTNSFAKKDEHRQEFPAYEEEAHSPELVRGMRVRHPTFGAGQIFQTEGSGDQQKVSVIFADQTVKKFVTKYARLERI